MSTSVALTDTITQVVTQVVEIPSDKLLQDRYFPTGAMDIFDSRALEIDLMHGDRKCGAFLKNGYANGDTTTFFSQTVEPPRISASDGIDTVSNRRDRMCFEQLSKMQGNIRPTRADAMNALLLLKLARCGERVLRGYERLAVMAIFDNAQSFTYNTSPTDSTPVTCDVQYYEGLSNPQAYSASVAWGSEGATPYADVAAAARELKNHGGRAADLLLAPAAWDALRADMVAKDIINGSQINFTQISNNKDDGSLYPDAMDYVDVIGKISFDGIVLNVLVYSGGYEDGDGVWQQYLPEYGVAILSPNCGRTLCGAVSKVNPAAVASYDVDAAVCLTGKVIATRHCSTEDDSVSVRCEAVPICVPNRIWNWITIAMPETDDDDNG